MSFLGWRYVADAVPAQAGARRHDLINPVRDHVPHTGHRGQGEPDLPWRRPSAQRPAGVRGLMADHGASAEVLWALGWGAVFIRGRRNTDYAPLQPQMTLAAAPGTVMGAIRARSRVSKT